MNPQAEHKTSSFAALGLRAKGGRDATITGRSVDSRDVKQGTIFRALPGTQVHGADSIQYTL